MKGCLVDTTMEYDTSRDASGALLSRSPLKRVVSKSAKSQDRDLTTGKCMTCNSMVRWPRELAVFRCSICATINDLTSISVTQTVRSNHVSHGKGEPACSHTPSLSRGPRINLDMTIALIERCIKVYLASRIGGNRESNLDQKELTPCAPLSRPGPTDRIQHSDITSGVNIHLDREAVSLPHPVCIATRNPENASPSGQISDTKSSPGSYERCLNINNSNTSTASNQYHTPGFAGIDSIGKVERRHTHQADEETNTIFKPLDDYIVASFLSHGCINRSFSTQRPLPTHQGSSEGSVRFPGTRVDRRQVDIADMVSLIDARTPLSEHSTENGTQCTSGRGAPNPIGPLRSLNGNTTASSGITSCDSLSNMSPQIDWVELCRWYDLIIHVGNDWGRHMAELLVSDGMKIKSPSVDEMNYIQGQVTNAQKGTRRVLLKATESLLKRPGGLLKEPDDIRFLLIILANPLLYPQSSSIFEDNILMTPVSSKSLHPPRNTAPADICKMKKPQRSLLTSKDNNSNGPGLHSSIMKRLLGLLSNLPNESHHHLVALFSKFSEVHFQRTTELVGSFVTYRLTRQISRKLDERYDFANGKVPSIPSPRHRNPAALHVGLGGAGHSTRISDERLNKVLYHGDWQMRAAARVMALLFAANNNGSYHQDSIISGLSLEGPRNNILTQHGPSHRHNQTLPNSHFYNAVLDYSDLIADFEAWEAKRGKFTFCQYPFFLSIWAKIQIMEHDARRQMEVKAREAFFDSIMTQKRVNQYLVLKIRRECLVEDSLKAMSEVVGASSEEIKKGLRIEFKDEEGIDAGGLRKEWFLLLIRDLLNPDHGMFVSDEESHVCYFNPNSFETSDQFFLVGVVVGLAIYNSTILDIPLPSFAFRKLLSADPSAAPSHEKPTMVHTLDDLAEYRPSLANGLRQLLEFDGDVEETFCRDFVADVEEYGQIHQVPLCPDGENRAVNNSNRREFVELYVKYVLDTSVNQQFEPFKRGFFTVCGGNALSLFQPEEIELLVRGSDEPLDISALQAVSVCDNWGVPNPAETEPVIQWFWRSFQNAHPKEQRKLLSFITGSDRIPALGATNLVIKLSCLGDDCLRFPVARTCFNMLSLWRYSSRQKFELLLWRAVNESEGFGLK